MKKQKSNPIQTILTITIGLLIIYYFTKLDWLLNGAIIIGLLGLISPYLRHKIDFLWMKLAWLLSLFIPNILLSIIFFGLLTPLAFIAKLFGKEDILNLKSKEGSLYKEVNKTYNKKSFEHPW